MSDTCKSGTDQQKIEAEMVVAPLHSSHQYWWAANCPSCGTRFDHPFKMDAKRNARNCCSVHTGTDQEAGQ